MDLRYNLPAATDAPRRARQELDRDLGLSSIETRQRLALALSEVVSNVIRHGELSDGQELTIIVDEDSRAIRVTVEQPTTVPVALPDLDVDRVGGLGLRIVEASVDRWGYETGPPGRVWFELAP
ncbi:MAG TPA: ATP-binding protein [Actinomycetota bacterium]|nr:ATP-binding protein [Actinomycetota bacterium]